ncbi:hypothetical protein GCM10011507_25100 [Edaphobacter acidisoli]|uniref:Uncharacterized protein n=1 Tax=Edaphobacter acidisoli TaxID=2040573 RepID=A0A916RVQ3_9BACT|nr:hypothetical protein [Edaphobacter acidisoli]GGA72452.1 hypothetical protein GCM10011507_25100 [Edaphobacter acidisoli]
MGHILGPITLFILFGWVAWLIFTSLRRYMMAKLQTSLQMKLLEKIDSGQNALQYVETEAGRSFLKSFQAEQVEVAAPYRSILSGVRWGIMLIAFGIAFLALKSIASYPEQQQVHIFIGSLALALGIGCELAAGATFFLSRSFGLLKRDGE